MDEKILYEVNVSLEKNKFNVLLTITDKQLLFKKKKGLFKKKTIVVKEILINDIKIIKDKVKVEQKDNKVIIFYNDDTFEFICENNKCAKEIISEINKLIVLPEKNKKFKGIAKRTVNVVKAAVLSGAAVDVYKGIKKKDAKMIAKAFSKFVDKF